MRRSVLQWLLPLPFRLFRSHTHTSPLSIRCLEKRRVNAHRRQFHSCSHVVTTGRPATNTIEFK
jgi:hypothetical protein